MKTLLLLILSVICGGCITVNQPGLPIPTKEQQAKALERSKKSQEVVKWSEEIQKRVREGKSTDDLMPPPSVDAPYPTSY